MNEFTKEELTYIQQALFLLKTTYPNIIHERKIDIKIKSLLDENCLHESNNKLYTRLGPAPYIISELKPHQYNLFNNNMTCCIHCEEYYLP